MGLLDDAWTLALDDLGAAWGGKFEKRDRAAYRRLITQAGFPPLAAQEAVQRLAASGKAFYPRPSAAEVIAECRAATGALPPGEFDAPTWGEISYDAEVAAYRYGRATAATMIHQAHGPVAASWLANGGGYDLMRSNLLVDRKLDAGRRSYESFVKNEREREQRGQLLSFERPGARLRVVEPIRALEAGE